MAKSASLGLDSDRAPMVLGTVNASNRGLADQDLEQLLQTAPRDVSAIQDTLKLFFEFYIDPSHNCCWTVLIFV